MNQEEGIKLRKEKVLLYKKLLDGIVKIPDETNGAHISIDVKKDINDLKRFLNKNGVDTKIYYSKVPSTEEYKETLTLPLFPELTHNQIKYICDMIKEFYALRNTTK